MNATLVKLPPYRDPLHELLDEVLRLKKRILSETGTEMVDLVVEKTAHERLSSILNLFNHIIIRREDLRPLQTRLATAGLATLGREEPNVLGANPRRRCITTQYSYMDTWWHTWYGRALHQINPR